MSWLDASRRLAALALLTPTLGGWTLDQSGVLDDAGSAQAVAVSDDGEHVALLESGGTLHVWEHYAFSAGPATVDVCSPAHSLVFASGATSGDRFYVGCEDGVVQYVDVDDSTVPPTLEVSDDIVVNVGLGEVAGLAFAADDSWVHAIVNWSVVTSSPSTGLFRVSLSSDTAQGNLIAEQSLTTASGLAIAPSGAQLVAATDDGMFLAVSRSGDLYTAQTGYVSLLGNALVDVAASDTTFALSDRSGDAVWQVPLGTAVASVLAEDLSDPGALVYVPGTSTLVVGQASAELVALDGDGDAVATGSLSSGSVQDLAADDDGTLYAAAPGGDLLVLRAGPWIADVTADPGSVGEGEAFTLTFTSDSAGDYTVAVGGDGGAGSGTQLAAGELLASEPVVIDSSAAELGREGDNRLYVRVTADGGAAVDSAVVVLDLPPDRPTGFALEAGGGNATASWPAHTAPDIDHYLLYLSDAEFTEEELPELDLVDDDGVTSSYPREVDEDGSSTYQVQVTGLTNGQTWYAALVAVDATGQRSPLSAIATAVPHPTAGAAALSGEQAVAAGCDCSDLYDAGDDDDSTASLVARDGPSLALLGVVGLGRRRRRS